MTMESAQITLVILPVNVILDTLEMDSHVKVKLTFVICICKKNIYIVHNRCIYTYWVIPTFWLFQF